MEAVELPLNGAIEVSKILSVEGFGGGSESREGVGKDPGFGRVSVGRCSNFSNDMKCRTTASEQNSVSRSKKANTGVTIFNSSLPSYVDEISASQVGKSLLTGKQLQRKSAKTSRDINFSSKRPRSEHGQISMSQGGFGDCNGLVGKHKSGPTDSTFAERSPAIGHKHSLDGKRGDKRNFKSPKRPKEDPFYAKIGLAKSSSSGVGSILGVYGLKSDNHGVTQHMGELSLDDLLDSSYKHPTFYRGKGKSTGFTPITNENIVDTIRKACSILQTRKPVEAKNDAELDSSSNRKTDTCISSSGSSVASGADCTKGDNNVEDLATSSKDARVVSITSPLAEPKDVLEQIALPPAKNLDALLLDTYKSALSRGTMTCGASLQPFPWSHCSGGPSRKALDTGKFPSNRSRWVRIGSIVNSPDNVPNCIDMNSLDFDHKSSISGSDAPIVHNSLGVALLQRFPGSFDRQLKPGIATENSLTTPKEVVEFSNHENVALMVPSLERRKFLENEINYTDSKQSKRQSIGDSSSRSQYSPLKSSVGGLDPHQRQLEASEKLIHAGHSPRLVAASLTLYEMARRPATENPNCGKLRWPKKPSQKTMKARKPRSTGKTEALSSIPRIVLGLCDSIKTDKILPSKKLKYSDNKKLDSRHTNHVGREPIKWSIPTSSRSPPTRSDNVEAKQLNSDSVKLGTPPSYKRGLDKGRDNELRKAVPMDWGRGKNKN